MTRRLGYLGPLLLALAALWLALSWQRIPAQWAVHWGAHGRADGFMQKSLAAAFLPLLIGLAPWALLNAIAAVMERAPGVPEVSRANALVVRLLAAGLAATFAMFAIAMPLWRPERPTLLLGWTALLILVPLVTGIVHVARVVAKLKPHHRELDGYHGIVYRNPNDERLLVPKLGGIGYTLNFARPAAWWVLALLLLPALTIVVVVALR